MSPLARSLPLLVALTGCAKLFPSKDKAVGPPVPLSAPTAEPAGPEAKTSGREHADQKKEEKAEKKDKEPERYAVPFAWESSPNEPLARARGFLAEVLRANVGQVALGRQHYAPFLEKQTPRATVVSCADSRVQTDAWDKTPENDDFIIRNLGNQLNNALGSVEYGVDQLHTPLLLIVGHTGCGAVQAVLEKNTELSPAIQAELANLKLPPAKAGTSAEKIWTDAVIANINAQVASAAEHFATRVHSGDLTIVGVLYDLRNSLSKGYGRLHVINVNTNTEPERIEAFIRAVNNAPLLDAAASALSGSEGPTRRISSSGTAPRSAPADPAVTDERVRAMIEKATHALPGRHPVATVTTSNEK